MANVTEHFDSLRDKHTVNDDDATWILTSAFIIFTMQSGKCRQNWPRGYKTFFHAQLS